MTSTKDKFYTARNDIVFKTIMLTKQEVLKKIIEIILEEEIEEIKILNNELTVVNVKSKKRVVDIMLQVQNKYINVEMNNSKEDYINLRNGTYIFNIINESINKGESYSKMMKNEYVGINLTYVQGGSEIRNEYMLQKRNGETFIKNFKIIEINMEKLNKDWYTLNRKEKKKYKYLQMLDLEEKKLEKFTEGDKIMKEYEEAIKKLNKDEVFRMHITEEEDAELMYRSDMELAEERGARQKAIETAKKMFSLSNITLEQIAEVTNLSIEEIKELKEHI